MAQKVQNQKAEKKNTKKADHPKMQYVTVTCTSCGSKFQILTTATKDFQVQVCSNCHPAYTGKQNEFISKVDRVAQFMQRMEKAKSLQKKNTK